MGSGAARVGDHMRQDSPHCHAPIHPPAPVPTPVPHQPVDLKIVAGATNVFVGGKQLARVGAASAPCVLPSCVPAGPGVVAKGSFSVFVGGVPAARQGDQTTHPSCVAPIPAPTGKIVSGSSTVFIGG